MVKVISLNKLVAVSLSDLYTICHKQMQNNFITYGPNLINIVNKNKSLWKYKNKNILFRWGILLLIRKMMIYFV